MDCLLTICNNLGYNILDEWPEDRLKSFVSDLCKTFNVLEDVDDREDTIQDIKASRKKLKALQDIPIVEQRSEQWKALRQNLLTASDLAQALGKGKFGSRKDLLRKKIFDDSKFNARCPPLKWGTMFEDVVMRCYQEKMGNVSVQEFGLIPHPDIPCFGASPDGITELGVMVELKAPYKRKIEMGQVPEQYYYQILGQLSVCGLEKCDYVEAEIAAYSDIQEYKELHPETTLHGVIIECTRNDAYEYIYSPIGLTSKQAYSWVLDEVATFDDNDERQLCKITPWKLSKINIVRVNFDEQKWAETVPLIYAFWEEVVEGRKNMANGVTDMPPPPSSTKTKTKAKVKEVKQYKKPKYDFVDDD